MEYKLTLGIATIGDLLLNNRIGETHSGDSVENVHLSIPPYQRPYKWTSKNVNQLLDDIEEAITNNKEVYRVGTLILHHDEDEDRYDIVDGQQRVITFSLLMRCLGIGSIEFMDQTLFGNEHNLRNVINNYRTLKRRLSKLFDDEKDRDRDKLAGYITNQCEMIVVITNDLSEAFQFFDSQNSRGKKLYPHDLLKAYHLREMVGINASETEWIARMWEDLDQGKLAELFGDYLYRLKEWLRGNRPAKLDEHNLDVFKGVSSRDNHPYAQYYKGAFAYIDELNHSHVPFVSGIRELDPFQINAPIIAGKPFFDYTKHYFDILADIQNNDKYEGYIINGNPIVSTLNQEQYKWGTGNRITRLLFDTAILLYVDRFCPTKPSKADEDDLEQFVVFAFIWAYSMRTQYARVGWQVAQNYVQGTPASDKIVNSFNIYKLIAEADSPGKLLSKLADVTVPLTDENVKFNREAINDMDAEEGNAFKYYLHFFNTYNFWE